jgi:hypothetical protein
LAGVVATAGAAYGAVMGAYGGFLGEGFLQILASASKVPFLLLATLLLSLPSFFVLNTLLGVRSDFPSALRAILASQAALTLALLSLAPVTAFAYLSGLPYRQAILFNALMFALASLGAQFRLRAAYRPLIARSPVHVHLLRAWLFVYALVGIQMGWLLRPFIGDPSSPFRFFREDAWGNAYVIVARMLWQVLAGQAS